MKIIALFIGFVLAAAGIHMIIQMDFTKLHVQSGVTDGFGFEIVSGDQATGLTKFAYDITSYIPYFDDGTHDITFIYILTRIINVIFITLGFILLLWGLLGPKNEEEAETMMKDLEKRSTKNK